MKITSNQRAVLDKPIEAMTEEDWVIFDGTPVYDGSNITQEMCRHIDAHVSERLTKERIIWAIMLLVVVIVNLVAG